MTTMPPTSNNVHAYRGRVLHFLHDPQYRERDAYEYWEDGLLVVAGGAMIAGKNHHMRIVQRRRKRLLDASDPEGDFLQLPQ